MFFRKGFHLVEISAIDNLTGFGTDLIVSMIRYPNILERNKRERKMKKKQM
jgi:hypothetical protein